MTTADRFENHCFKAGCRRVALYGHHVDLLRGRAGIWACRDHRDELEAKLRERQAAAQAEADKPAQGSLL